LPILIGDPVSLCTRRLLIDLVQEGSLDVAKIAQDRQVKK